MISLDVLRELVKNKRHYYTVHAQEQMALRHIEDSEIRETILGKEAEIMQEYADDKYSPSCLIYGATLKGRILHVQSNYQGVIITAYKPDSSKWHNDMKRRRK